MNGSTKTLAMAVIVLAPVMAWGAQQSTPQLTSEPQAALTRCAQGHALAARTLDTADRRLETARLANSPAAMRAAIDDLQAALRQLRADIAPCAGAQTAPATDAHTGHATPPAPAADPHAGHIMPSAPAK